MDFILAVVLEEKAPYRTELNSKYIKDNWDLLPVGRVGGSVAEKLLREAWLVAKDGRLLNLCSAGQSLVGLGGTCIQFGEGGLVFCPCLFCMLSARDHLHDDLVVSPQGTESKI